MLFVTLRRYFRRNIRPTEQDKSDAPAGTSHCVRKTDAGRFNQTRI